jgi:hypothetical protein
MKIIASVKIFLVTLLIDKIIKMVTLKTYNMRINEINTGDVFVTSSSSFLSKKIQWFTKSKWSHTAIFWWCYGELFVIESDKFGVRNTPFKDYLKPGVNLHLQKPRIPINGVEIGKFMLPMVGNTPYSYFNSFVAQPVYILSGKRIWIGRNKGLVFNCAEFVSFVYNNITSIPFFPYVYKITPEDIFENPYFTHHTIEYEEYGI